MYIDQKLTLSHLGPILVFVVIIGLLGDQVIKHSLEESGREKLHFLTDNILNNLNQKIQDYGQAVSNTIDSRAMNIYMDDFDDRPLLDIFRQQEIQFDQISLLGEAGLEELRYVNGSLVTANSDYKYDQDFLDARWISNQPVIRFHSATTDAPARLIISQVKKNFFDEFGGSIRATREAASMFQEVLKAPQNTHLYVTDSSKRLVFSVNAEKTNPAIGRILSCDAAPALASFVHCNDRELFLVTRPINQDGWQLIAGIPASDFLAPLYETRKQLLFMLGLLILTVVIISLLLARHIQKPLSQLVKASRQIGEGNRDVTVNIDRGDELGMLGMAFNNMSQSLQESNKRIEYLAYNDELTGLPNRRLLMNNLEKALASGIRHGQHGALIMLDLDRFKNINDSLGHAAGDKLLMEVGSRLTDIVRKEDTVCRLGGDEFVVLLPFIERDGDDYLGHTSMIARKILEKLSTPYQLGDSQYITTASIGVVLFPHLDDSPENLLKRADAAMYRSKHNGGNRFSFYEKAIQQAADERLALEKDLRLAINNEEITLAFQPQCDLEGKVVGVEALARWKHSIHGMVPPPRFIEIAEETGLIMPLGHWIMEKACAEVSSLSRSGEMPCLSVNVSAFQFRDPSFYDRVLSLIDTYQLPPGNLKLELTESALLHDVDDTIRCMQRLHDAGIQFSLDDFGTGYSSLSYLSRLPLNEVKIDRSFLADAKHNLENWAIIEAVIDIAEALGLTVVTEGVEDAEEIKRLSSIGCEIFQGYYISRPTSFNEFRAFLNTRNNNSDMAS